MKRRKKANPLEEYIPSKPVKKTTRKITRTLIKTVLFLSVMFVAEWVAPRYAPFNTLRHTTFSEVPGIGPWIQDTVPLIQDLSFYYTLAVFLTLLIIPSVLKAQSIMNEPMNEKKQLRKLRRIHSRMDYVQFATFIGMAYVLLNTFFFSLANVSGSSMNDNFFDQDDVIISHAMDRLTYGDVVVVQVESEYFLKRVVGLPGDNVSIESGAVYVNGTVLDEPYLGDVQTLCYGGPNCDLTLSDTEYYVLGDNRTNSTDSRALGAIESDAFFGHVIFILRPFDRIGPVQP